MASHPEIFHKIIDIKCVEFFPYHEFFNLNNDEVKQLIEKVDAYLHRNLATTQAELYAKDIWETDIRTSLIEVSL